MTKKPGISIIGAGRVGWHLAQALSAAGYPVCEVWSRRQSQAQALTERLPNALVAHSLDFSQSQASLFLLTVKDAAIEEVARRLLLPAEAVLAHTSGSQPLQAIAHAAPHTGVLYPLQTFSKEKTVSFSELPFCIESSDSTTTGLLKEVAQTLSHKVIEMNTDQRQQLHLAAVFACNFSNHMLRIAQDLLAESKLPEDLLHPLIQETVQKALTLGPANAQTGPALRGDTPVLEQHQKLLFQQPEWLEIYTAISANIRTLSGIPQ